MEGSLQMMTGEDTVLDADATDLHAALNTVDTPLMQLDERDLTPGAAALEKFNASLR